MHNTANTLVVTTFIFFTSLFSPLLAQSFGSSGLSGESVNNPTSLQFGPDGRLYVSQQDGTLYAYTVVRNAANDYQVTATETILDVKDIQNYDDDGTLNNGETNREVTGLLVVGTASNPILYVSSSDFRIGGGGGGNDPNLDTNSGIISRLTRSGNNWNKVDLVRGLPRSEENHATNGMQLDEATNTLYVAQGGHTNAGAPSNNFAFTTEYALSAAILTVDLDAIDALPISNDNGSAYVYDIPTLDDPTRPNVNGQDVNDPFGGNDGLNQAKIVPGGPVQVYSPGFRNIYDVVLTNAGNLYTWDNGPNGGWGGHPDNEGGGNATNNWVPGEPGSSNAGPNDPQVNNRDGLHFIDGSNYYGGHPNPIRANPSGAGLFTHDQANGSGGSAGVWRTSHTNNVNTTLPSDWPPVPLNQANPIEGDFQNPGETDGSLFTINASTNGMAEYTASNFGGSLQGNLLAASFNENIYRIDLNNAGSINNSSDVSVFASGFGSNPLDVTAQGDNDPFPGTVWAATYGSDNIVVFEPSDYSETGNPQNPISGDDIYINAGGPSVTTNGINWSADQYFQSNSTFSTSSGISGTVGDIIYQTERSGRSNSPMSYQIPVANGTYTVELHFAEIYSGTQNPGTRVFDVLIEGNTVLNNFDIASTVGYLTATVQTFSATVTDGTLNINFAEEIENPKVSAIAVISQNVNCVGNPSNSIDEDGDGYTNSDELDNGTNPCNAADKPADFDGTSIGGFLVSNLNDPDDDDDGILDTADKFAWDADNGLSTNLPINYPFLNGDPGFGFFGLGFTGLMTNGSTDYLDLIQDENNSSTEIIAGGAVGLFTLNGVSNGDPIQNANSQENGFQFGVDVDSNTSPFAIESGILGPVFFNSPDKNQSVGIFLGSGDQNNYLKLTVTANSGNPGLQVLFESGGSLSGGANNTYPIPGIGSEAEIKLKLLVDPAAGNIQPQYAFGNDDFINVGGLIQLNGAALNSLQSSANALAVGLISTTFNSNPNFNATWDYLNIEFESPDQTGTGNWDFVNNGNSCNSFGSSGSCAQGRHEASYVHVGDKFYLLGGRENGSSVNIYDPISDVWTTGATPPLLVHHFQAVEYKGLIFVAGAFTGNFPSEPPIERILIYDPVADTWLDGPTIPSNRRRGSAGVVVYNNKIYIVCGIENGHQSGWVPWLDEYDPATNSWRQLPDAPHSRDHFHAALSNGKIFVAGGRRSGQDGVFNATEAAVDIFDLASETWTTNQNDIPTERAAPAVAVLGNEILYIGGEKLAGSANDETEALNVNTGNWRTLSPLNIGRHGTQAIVNNNNVYITAGSPNRGGGSTRTQERFYFDSPTTPSLSTVTKGTLSAPSSVTVSGGSDFISIQHASGNQAILIQDVNVSNNNFSFSIPIPTPFLLSPGQSFDVEVSNTSGNNVSANLNIEHTGSSNGLTTVNLSSGDNNPNPVNGDFCPQAQPWTDDDFSVSDVTETYSSGSLDMSCVDAVCVSITLEGVGNMETADFVNVYYKIDGGPQIPLSENVDAFNEKTVEICGISGNSIELVLIARTSHPSETYFISNIQITEDSGGEEEVEECDLPWTDSDYTVSNETDVYSSGVIDISCVDAACVSVTLEGVGNMETADFVNVYYKLDGGPEIPLSENVDAFGEKVEQICGLNANTIELIIEAKTSVSSETYFISDVRIFEDMGTVSNDNIAPQGTASQSSTAFGGVASRAIDRNTSGFWNQGSVTHTANQVQPWWQVTWTENKVINEIVIFNRMNSCCINRLSDFTVSILNANGNPVFSQSFNSAPTPSVSIDIGGIVGRTVQVQLNINGPLSLAEVEVYGYSTSNFAASVESQFFETLQEDPSQLHLKLEDDLNKNSSLIDVKNSVKGFPNPTSGYLFVDLSDRTDTEVRVSIADLTGKLLIDKNLSQKHSNVEELNLSHLHNGMYILYIKSEGQEVYTEKILLNHSY